MPQNKPGSDKVTFYELNGSNLIKQPVINLLELI
jgi:hypothetical protein